MNVEDLRTIAVFDGLSDAQLLELCEVGDEQRFTAGEELFREARPADYWWVLLEGTIQLVRHVGSEETVLATMDVPGQWAGGFRAWDPHGVYLATGRTGGPGRVLRVPAEMLRDRANAWFPFGVHLITGLVTTVRRVESVARQRESLVALGRLAAGLAHEINNPASAATRAVDALHDISEELAASLGRLAGSRIAAPQFAELDALRQEVAAQSTHIDPLAMADREDAVADWLAGRGIRRDWLLAPPLAAAGIDVAWCERAAASLEDDSLEAGLEWVANSLSMAALLTEAKDSIARISELVSAVRSYSQLDRASLQRIDITEGLESTLVMLGHRLGDGVTVVRDYDTDIPRLEAIPGELNQVWTHVIDNAIEAMGGTGTLRLHAREEGDAVIVEIGDTGRGLTPDVQAHAFEPFYTTKDVGQGTGLGLDISRRIIVERHGGEIAIESLPAETVLRVRLPLQRKRTL